MPCALVFPLGKLQVREWGCSYSAGAGAVDTKVPRAYPRCVPCSTQLNVPSCTHRAAFGDADELIQVGLTMGDGVMRGDRDVTGVGLASVQGPSDAWEGRKRTREGKAGGGVAAHCI